MAFLLLAVAALVPLAFAPGALLFYDVTPKVLVLLCGTSVLAVRYAISAERPPRSVRWFGWLLVLYIASTAVSTLVSVRPDLSLAGTNWRRFGLVTQIALAVYAYVAAAVTASRPELRRKMLAIVAASASLAALYGIAQYFGLDPWIDPKLYHVGEGEWQIVRPPSTMGHANYAAVVYLAGVFAGATLVRAGYGWGWAAVAIGSAAVLLGGSRAALLGLVVGAVAFRFPRSRRVFACFAAAIVAIAIFYVTPPGRQMRARVRWFLEDSRGGARPMLWRATLQVAMERPLAGWGPETFTGVFVERQPEDLAAAYPDYYQESAHNLFLDVLATQGLPAFVLLAALCAMAWPGAAVLAMLIALQFNAFTLPTAFCLLLAIALHVASRADPVPAARSKGPVARWLRPLLGAGLALVCLTCAVSLALWDWRLKLVDSAIGNGDVEGAMHAWARAEDVKPFGAAADLWYSRRLLSIATGSKKLLTRAVALREALRSGEIAARTAEDPQNAWYHLSTLYAMTGDTRQTEHCLRQSIRAAPRWYKPRWTLARLLLLKGDGREAEYQGDLAVRFGGSKYPEVTETLAHARTMNKK